METGPDGAGAELLRSLMRHTTAPRFVYRHVWQPEDTVMYDNRCLMHCATWFDPAAAPVGFIAVHLMLTSWHAISIAAHSQWI